MIYKNKIMKNKPLISVVISVTLIALLLLEFFLLNPLGIRLGYFMSGGKTTVQSSGMMPSELRREYEEMVNVYNLYKDDENSTSRRWAETAREKANSLAEEYNYLMNDYVLKEIY